MKRRILSVSLIFCIMLTLLPVGAAAASVTGHWSEPAVKICREYGILANDPGYDPDEVITRAEFVRMINRAFNFTETAGAKEFSDVDYGGEYGGDIKIASAMSYISGYGENFGPDDSLTREMAFTILARIYALTGDETAKTKFTDDDDISAWARGAISAMIGAGYVAGTGNNMLSPQKALSKGEAAQILYNLFGGIAEKDADGGAYKNLTVRKTGVTVKNAMVTGDIFVTDGVGTGDVTLDGVTVKGRALITGGGSNSASFRNSTLNDLVMSGRHNTHAKLTSTTLKTLTFLASGKVTAGSAVIAFDAASGKLTLTGTFDKITENTDKTVTVTINGLTFTIRFGADKPLKSLARPVTTSSGGGGGGGSSGGVTYYSITFNSNGGSGSMAAITGISSGSTIILPANSFTRAGHTFAGWAAGSSGAVAYTDGASVTVGSSLTLYAVWTVSAAPTYTISHNVAGGAHIFTGATEGYGVQTPLTVTITNTGNTALTGGSIALTTGTAFDLSKSALNAIASGMTDTFTVTPKTALAVGTYNDTVTVTGAPGGETAAFTVSFTVSAPTYTISHDVPGSAHTFTGATAGYGAQTPLTVTITNTGNTALTGGSIVLATGTAFDLGKTTLAAIASGMTDTFTVTPKTALAVGTYNDTVTVTGTPGGQTAVFTVSFTVAQTYTVTYNANGGAVSPGSDIVQSGGTVTPPTPAKTGAVFGGWNTAGDGSGTAFTAATPVTGNITIYAMWLGENNYYPIEISTATDLDNIRNGLGKHYKLVSNISLSGWNGGGSWTPIGDGTNRFTGSFDGGGYTISDMKITGDVTRAGLFGYIGANGTVKNLTLMDVDINITYSGNAVYVGGVAGYIDSSGIISNCNAVISGSVSATSTGNAAHAGGIAGYSFGQISNCYAVISGGGSVSATSTGGDFTCAGGVAGYVCSGQISNCYAVISGSVSADADTGSANAGGVAGRSFRQISSCYVVITGSVSATSTSGTTNAGGIEGHNGAYAISDCAVLGNGGVSATGGSSNYAGRVAGKIDLGTLTGNYADSAMTVTVGGSNKAPLDKGLGNNLDGEDVSSTLYNTEAWWSTFWAAVWGGGNPSDTKPWVWGSSLPKLYWEQP